jgi:hypothetical protein
VVKAAGSDGDLARRTGERIDFTFTRPNVVVDKRDMAYDIMTEKHGGNPNYISDHRMEWVKIKASG